MDEQLKEIAQTIYKQHFQNIEVDSLRLTSPILNHHILYEPSKTALEKSKEKFEYYKTRGNQAFVSRNINLALNEYQNASKFASTKEDLAISYGNISAILFESGKHLMCLIAIIEAISSGHPREIRLYKRTLECFKNLGTEIPSEILNARYMSTCLSVLQEVVATLKSKNLSIPEFALKYVGKKDFKRNKDIQVLSESVSMIWDENKGSCMVANDNICPGDIILSESPVAKSLNLKNSEKFCHECLNAVRVPYPCENCVNVMFCSRQCQEIGLDCHKRECPYLAPLYCDSETLWCVRLICQYPPQEFIDQTLEIFEENKKAKSVYGKICELGTHFKTSDHLLVMKLSKLSWFVSKLLENYFKGCSTTVKSQINAVPDVTYHVAFVVLKLLSASVRNRVPLHTNSSSNRGFILALMYSRFNHSCDSNTVAYYVGGKRFLVAKRPITNGEEITTNFGHSFTSSTYAVRQEYLKSIYRVAGKCFCAVCQNPPAFVKETNGEIQIEELHTFICKDCNEKNFWSYLKLGENLVCKKCQKHCNMMQFANVYLAAENMRKCENFHDEKNFRKLLDLLLKFHLFSGSPSYMGCLAERELEVALNYFANESTFA